MCVFFNSGEVVRSLMETLDKCENGCHGKKREGSNLTTDLKQPLSSADTSVKRWKTNFSYCCDFSVLIRRFNYFQFV